MGKIIPFPGVRIEDIPNPNRGKLFIGRLTKETYKDNLDTLVDFGFKKDVAEKTLKVLYQTYTKAYRSFFGKIVFKIRWKQIAG